MTLNYFQLDRHVAVGLSVFALSCEGSVLLRIIESITEFLQQSQMTERESV